MRIEDRVGVTYRQLHQWTQLGYIRADGGNGEQYRYPESEIRTGRIIGHLVHLGISPRIASRLARELMDHDSDGTLELRDGKLKVTGSFARLLKESLPEKEAEPEPPAPKAPRVKEPLSERRKRYRAKRKERDRNLREALGVPSYSRSAERI